MQEDELRSKLETLSEMTAQVVRHEIDKEPVFKLIAEIIDGIRELPEKVSSEEAASAASIALKMTPTKWAKIPPKEQLEMLKTLAGSVLSQTETK